MNKNNRINKVVSLITVLSTAGLMAGCLGGEPARETGEEVEEMSAIAALTSNPSVAGIAGCWRVTQPPFGDSPAYVGSLAIQQDGSKLKGFMDWDNHEDAVVTGTAGAGKVEMVFTYLGAKQGLVGNYPASVSADGRTLTSTGAVGFTMILIPCGSGCWSVNEAGRRGMLTMTGKNGTSGGFMDWDVGPDAVVTSSTNGTEAVLRSVIPSDPSAPARIYTVQLDWERLRTLNGTSYEEGKPGKKENVSGVSVPCKDASGCFNIRQVNKNGVKFLGRMRFNVSGKEVTGMAQWTNHVSGNISGSLEKRFLSLNAKYPGKKSELEGRYELIIDAGGDYLTGYTKSGKDSGNVMGMRALCPTP